MLREAAAGIGRDPGRGKVSHQRRSYVSHHDRRLSGDSCRPGRSCPRHSSSRAVPQTVRSEWASTHRPSPASFPAARSSSAAAAPTTRTSASDTDPESAFVHSNGGFRCLEDVGQGPLQGCLKGRASAGTRTASCEHGLQVHRRGDRAREDGRDRRAHGRPPVRLLPRGDGNDASFKNVKVIVADHDLAHDIDGIQNVWIQQGRLRHGERQLQLVTGYREALEHFPFAPWRGRPLPASPRREEPGPGRSGAASFPEFSPSEEGGEREGGVSFYAWPQTPMGANIWRRKRSRTSSTSTSPPSTGRSSTGSCRRCDSRTAVRSASPDQLSIRTGRSRR